MLNSSRFFSFLEPMKQPYTVVKFLNILEDKLEKKNIDCVMKSENRWILFEYLRQIFKKDELKLNDHELELISLLLGRLYDFDESFFYNGTNFLSKYRTKNCLGIALGKFLSDKNETEIIEPLIESFGIDDKTFNLEMWSHVCKTLKRENKPLLLFLNQIVFNKWDNFLKEQFNNEKILTSLIFTDYVHIVICHFQYCIKNGNTIFFELLEEKLNSLMNYKSFWIKNPSRKRFVGFSYLYSMSMAWKNVHNTEINEQSLKEKLCFILDDERLKLSLPSFFNETNNLIFEIKSNFGIK